jgi:hypothetical protein
MSLTRDQFLSPCELRVEKVPAPEKGGIAYVRVMSGIERDLFESSIAANRNDRSNFRGRLLVRCICDESGKLLFTPEDAALLGAQPGTLVDRLAKVAMRINRMTDDSLEDAKGNSNPSPGAAQSSDSP